MGKNVTNPNFNLPIVCCWFGRLHVELQLGYFRLSYSPPRSCKNTEMFWRWFWLSLVTNGPFLFFQNPLFERSRSPSGFSFHSVALSTFIVSFQTPQERNMGMHETRNCTSGYFLFFFFFPSFFYRGEGGWGCPLRSRSIFIRIMGSCYSLVSYYYLVPRYFHPLERIRF